MEEAKAPLVFREEWAEQVKKILHDRKSLANARYMPRVTPLLLKAKPEAYIPDFVSLGPYHHWTLEKKIAASSSAGDSYEFRELKMSTAEAYKVQSAASFLWIYNESIEEMVEKIKKRREEIGDFYDWPIPRDGEYLENFALMMAIDSLFLLRFLCSPSESSDEDMKCLKRLEVSIKCDILKLENQIPLFLLIEALKDAAQQVSQDFNKVWRNKFSAELSPFNQFDITLNYDHQPHFLGCLHAFLSRLVRMEVEEGEGATVFRRMKHSLEGVEVVIAAVFTLFRVTHPSKEGLHDILNSYNAGELAKGGIQFKPFSTSTMNDQIRFNKYSGTLYLPQITVSEMQTEVLLRNMLALEFNDFTRGDHMTRFVGLMDCLIDSPEDVQLLRESQVILRGSVMMTDKSIADMWNSMCLPIFKGYMEPPDYLNNALKEVLIRKYYMSIVKKVVWEFYWEHLSKPGRGEALFVGILLLAVSFAQTFFAWCDWSNNKNCRH